MGPKQYTEAFNLLKDWIEKTLDIYKVNLAIFPTMDLPSSTTF